MRAAWLLALAGLAAAAQPAMLTLAEAEAAALKNHPRLAAARALAEAAREPARQARAQLSPVVAANMTGSVAENGTRLGAGNPNASSLFSRTAAGFQINQMVWDFGRVRAFAASLDARADAMKEAATGARAEVLWRVRGTYFRALAAQTQLRVMAANLEARRLTMRQVKALTDSQLRSTLDLSFAELHVAEAEMAQLRAESEVRTAAVELAAAMGETEAREYTLADPGDPAGAVGAGVEEVVREAMEGRAELAALRQQARAATRFADSEKRQGLPMLTATGVAGMFGWRDANLRQRYGALAMNLNIPLFNGGQFKSRAAEADLRAESVRQELREMEVRVAREVRAAWVEVENARRRMALTGKVVEQARRTEKLAQSRYDLGLGTIVELSSAQLSRTTAEVEAALARLAYLGERTNLEYRAGRYR
jgi:outer membrane protein